MKGADAFADLFSAHATSALVANLRTRVEVVEVEGQRLPLTVNDADEVGNCYICRPSAAFVDYALEETRHLTSDRGRAAMQGLIRATAPMVRATGLDHQVQVNNWLLSTNPAPVLRDAAALRDGLVARFPGRAIVLRSLNHVADAATMEALAQAGFALLPTRQVWVYDCRADVPPWKRERRRDEKLAKRSLFVSDCQFRDTDWARAEVLYGMLYLRKYTFLNPQYTALFLREMVGRGLLRMRGLRDPGTGELVAVSGLFRQGQTLTQPIVGYDVTRPQAEGLYRLMMLAAQRDAEEAGLFYNVSAGAGAFKRLRGAVPVVEYAACYVRHLGFGRRAMVGAVGQVLRRVGVPLLERMGL